MSGVRSASKSESARPAGPTVDADFLITYFSCRWNRRPGDDAHRRSASSISLTAFPAYLYRTLLLQVDIYLPRPHTLRTSNDGRIGSGRTMPWGRPQVACIVLAETSCPRRTTPV